MRVTNNFYLWYWDEEKKKGITIQHKGLAVGHLQTRMPTSPNLPIFSWQSLVPPPPPPPPTLPQHEPTFHSLLNFATPSSQHVYTHKHTHTHTHNTHTYSCMLTLGYPFNCSLFLFCVPHKGKFVPTRANFYPQVWQNKGHLSLSSWNPKWI